MHRSWVVGGGLISWMLSLWLGAMLLAPPAWADADEVQARTVRLHFHRPDHDYLGWGLYVWGAGLKLPRSVTWDRPLEPSGVDAFGVYFDVRVAPTAQAFSFILHRGDTKSWPEDLAVDLQRDGRAVWIVDGSPTVHRSPPPIGRAFEVGAEVEREQQRSRQLMAAAALGGLLLVLLAGRLLRRRLSRRADALTEQLRLLTQAQQALREQGERLRASGSDELTGLPTRGGVQQALDHALALAAREGGGVMVMFVDLDGFKAVNDGAGHDAGDAVLQAVAQRLRGALRGSDVLGRVGGDEFVVVSSAPWHSLQAYRLGLKLVRAASEPVLHAGQTHQVGASVGLALYPDDGRDAVSLWKAADAAMYEAKRAGKGDCRFQSASRQAEVEQQLRRERSLRDAVQAGQLRLSLQAVQGLRDGDTVAWRSQLEWLHEGRMQPVLPVLAGADDARLGDAVDRWLIAAAVDQAARQPQALLWLRLAAADQALAGEAASPLPAQLRDRLAARGLPPQRLLLEFPARLMSDRHRPLDLLLRLRAQGLRIALAGDGLQDLPLQRLIEAPLDLLVVEAPADGGADGSAWVRALAAVGAQCGFQVAARGQGLPAQREWALASGCDWWA